MKNWQRQKLKMKKHIYNCTNQERSIIDNIPRTSCCVEQCTMLENILIGIADTSYKQFG